MFSKCALKISLHTVQFLCSSPSLFPLPLRETDQANRCTRFTHPPFAGSFVLSCFAPAHRFFSVFCFFSFVLFGFSAGPFWVFSSAPCGLFGVFGRGASSNFWGVFLFVPPVRGFFPVSLMFCFVLFCLPLCSFSSRLFVFCGLTLTLESRPPSGRPPAQASRLALGVVCPQGGP